METNVRDTAEEIAEYRGKAECVQAWLEDVNNQRLKIVENDSAGEEERKVLQGIFHNEAARRQDLVSLEEFFNVLANNPDISDQIEYYLNPENIRKHFDISLRAVRHCLVMIMLNEADEMLRRGDEVMGDQERFADALEEQEEFFADSNHLGNAEEILQELEASSIGQDQTDTENLRQRLVTISEKEPQVHGRLASAIASWKQYDVLYDELENGAIQCRRDLATLQGMPAAVSPQEVTDKITQLNNVNERNSQLFSIVQALREQIELLASLATLEQHKNISNAVDALYNGLEETSRTIEDLKIHLKDHLENADKRAKSVERHCEKLELTARELDAKVSSLPAIEDNLEQLSELPLSLEAISNELEGYKEELETLQQMARNVEGCLDSTVIEKLQGLNRHLDDLSAGVAGKNAEVSAAAKRVQEVTEKLDVVENEINALSSKFEGDILDQVVALELSAVQGRFESLQGYCHQLQELHLELNDCRKQFPAQGSLITRTLETRADALSLRAETAVSRGFSQLTTLTDVQDKLSQVESDARDISLWADKANNKLAFESSQWKQELELELEEKKSMLSNICIIANALTSAYPNMDSQALSNLMGDDWTKLHKVQDTLSAKCREKVRSDENGLEVNMETLDDLYNPVMTVLEDIETRLQSREFDVAYDIQQIEWRLNRCQAIQSDMDAHAPDYDMVFEKAEELKLELAESQHPTIDRKLKELDSKWTSVADLLTNRLSVLRDQLEVLVRDTEVINSLEAWLYKKQQRLCELNYNGDQESNPSDILFELKELTVQISERKATLEQFKTNEEGARDLANLFGTFENDVNSAKARLLAEKQPNMQTDILQRIGKLESQVQAIGHAYKELRQEIDSLKAEKVTEEEEKKEEREVVSGSLESRCVDLDMLDEQFEHVDVMSENSRIHQKLQASKGVEMPNKDVKPSWNFIPVISFLALFIFSVVLGPAVNRK